MQKIELKTEGPIKINILKVLQESLGNSWIDAALKIRDRVFILGDMAGEHDQLMQSLSSLQEGDIIEVGMPDKIKFDKEALRVKFTAALSNARRAEVERELEKIRQGINGSGIDARLLF